MSKEVVTAAVLIIGDEILSGRTQDVNLQFIAKFLLAKGVVVRECQVIPDIEEVIVSRINSVRYTHDYVLTTGGIGPTHDDITAESVAIAFGVHLVENQTIANRIKRVEAPPDVMTNRLRMARVPEGATLIENSTGGPQGFQIENVYCMAGIPSVLQNMLPNITFVGGDVVKSRTIAVHTGESTISAHLSEIQNRFGELSIGSYPFYRDGIYGTELVMRSPDERQLDDCEQAIRGMLDAQGVPAR